MQDERSEYCHQRIRYCHQWTQNYWLIYLYCHSRITQSWHINQSDQLHLHIHQYYWHLCSSCSQIWSPSQLYYQWSTTRYANLRNHPWQWQILCNKQLYIHVQCWRWSFILNCQVFKNWFGHSLPSRIWKNMGSDLYSC